MVRDMDMKDVVFTGIIDVKEYIGRMDFLMLTSISEGQPLSILEGFAAKKPYIATNVGNCRGLIDGENDTYGPAGYIVPVMGVSEIARAILMLAKDEKSRTKMGQAGYQRVREYYDEAEVFGRYYSLYQEMTERKEEI